MRDFNLISWLIIFAYPYCTSLPFTNHVQNTFSDILCPVVIQNDDELKIWVFRWLLKLLSQLLYLYRTERHERTGEEAVAHFMLLPCLILILIWYVIDIHFWANCAKTFIVRSEESVFDLILPLISERESMALCLCHLVLTL
jgi:hypothetical protein